MMKVTDALNQAWSAVVTEALQAEGDYHRRIHLQCAWPAHAGIHRPTNTRILLLEIEIESVRKLRLKDETKGYSIDVSADEAGRTGRATIRIQEMDPGYRDVFTIFCADILEHWIPHAGASDAIQSLSRQLARWKKFFQRGAQIGLKREDYIGLYGELSFIEDGLSKSLVHLHVVNAWQGPAGTNQDFLFGQVAVEIKTTTGNDIDLVNITNARQLDSAGLQYLFLARYAFDFRQQSGRTLPQLVASLKASLASVSNEALTAFNDQLLEVGFVEAIQNDFDEWGFTLRRFDVFTVGEGFPRLIESEVPSGVSNISYTLNLSTAQPFHISEPDFWPRIISAYA